MKKNISIIRVLGGFFFLGLMNQSRKFIVDNKLGLCFNLICFIIALILFTFHSKNDSKQANSTIDKRKKVLIKLAVGIAILSFVITLTGTFLTV